MLKLENIRKSYRLTDDESVVALKGVTLGFRENEFVSILGPSGCGKTTLMNVIGGLDKYDDGDLIIDGRSTKEFSDSEWDNYRNKKIGFIFQSYNLIPHQTVLGNVELALTLSGISPDERKKRAKEALEKVGLGNQLNKKPNQLSGGQMQRVAIARALVNSPEILLADEPTGALDTATSEQIMQLIKEIAADKLVIMVTHNPTIAEEYSTRLIKMLDGEILSDSDPYFGEAKEPTESEARVTSIENAGANAVTPNVETTGSSASGRRRRKRDKTSMSFLTALSLSLKNLFTKKGRTILTAIAGSIGIIGISLILAISNGMNGYIAKMTTDTLSGNPITVQTTAIDINAAMNMMAPKTELEKFPQAKKLFVERISAHNDVIKKNVITESYLDYLKDNLSKSLYNEIIYKTGQEINAFTTSPESGETIKLSQTDDWQMLADNAFLNTQYDVICGRLPEAETELLLVVDEYNRLSDTALTYYGILSGADKDTAEIDFDTVVGKTYYIAPSSAAYRRSGEAYEAVKANEIDISKCLSAQIVGIIRINQDTDLGILKSGMCYTKALYNKLLKLNGESEIVAFMRDNPTKNPLTGTEYIANGFFTGEELREDMLRSLGGISMPNDISIYAKDFDTKNEIKKILDSYNSDKADGEKIAYTDMSEIMGSMLSSMVDVISYILIAFTAISLIVSCVMIGIITYISVIERTKEIGILRAIGARKKDITRVFNAETFIIGFVAGVIGILVTLILTIPVNAIIHALTGVGGIASLNVLHAIIMIAVSIILTVISGLIPAFKASKKDPVAALRTE